MSKLQLTPVARDLRPFVQSWIDNKADTLEAQILRDATFCAQNVSDQALLKVNSDGYVGVRRFSVGDGATDSEPDLSNWYNESNIVLESLNWSSLAFHTAHGGASFIRGNQDEIDIGYDAGWGNPRIRLADAATIDRSGMHIVRATIEDANIGNLYTRFLEADELRVHSLVVEAQQAVNGQLTVTPACAKLAQDFTAPAAGSTASLYVDEMPGYTGQVFADSDLVRVSEFTRSGSGLSATFCYGTVVYVSRDATTSPPSQLYTFTRSSAPNAGAMTTGTIVPRGAIVQDFGAAGGGGFIQINALNTVNANHVSANVWTSHPNDNVTKARLGNLKSITGTTGEYGVYAGDGTTNSTASYAILSNTQFLLNNVPLKMYYSGTQSVNWSADGSFWIGRTGARLLEFTAGASPVLSIAATVKVGNEAGVEGTFTSTDADTVSWTGVVVHLRNGTYITVSPNGDTGNMTGKLFLYVDGAGASTQAMSTTIYESAFSDNPNYILVAVCKNGADKAFVSVNRGLTIINGDQIATGSIVADNIKASTITGDKVSLTSYLSINSNTYGTSGIQLQYNGGTPRAYIGDGSNKFFQFDGTNISWKAANCQLNTTGNITAASGEVTISDSGIVLDATAGDTSPGVIKWKEAGNTIARIGASTTAGAYIKVSEDFRISTTADDITLDAESANIIFTANFVNIPSTAGVPTGGADQDMILDTSNSRIYFKVGGSWKYAALT